MAPLNPSKALLQSAKDGNLQGMKKLLESPTKQSFISWKTLHQLEGIARNQSANIKQEIGLIVVSSGMASKRHYSGCFVSWALAAALQQQNFEHLLAVIEQLRLMSLKPTTELLPKTLATVIMAGRFDIARAIVNLDQSCVNSTMMWSPAGHEREYRLTPLTAVLLEDGFHYESVEFLIANGANVSPSEAEPENKGMITPLEAAVLVAGERGIEALRSDKQNFNLAMCKAAELGAHELVKLFFQNGANVDFCNHRPLRETLRPVPETRNIDEFLSTKGVAEGRKESTATRYNNEVRGRATTQAFLLQHGAKIVPDTVRVALHSKFDEEIAALISKHGVDISSDLEGWDKIIFEEALKVNQNVVTLLLSAGVEGQLSIHHAIYHAEALKNKTRSEGLTAIRTLVGCGVQVSNVDRNGQTPLHLAAKAYLPGVIVELMKQNVAEYLDVQGRSFDQQRALKKHLDYLNFTDKHGNTALDLMKTKLKETPLDKLGTLHDNNTCTKILQRAGYCQVNIETPINLHGKSGVRVSSSGIDGAQQDGMREMLTAIEGILASDGVPAGRCDDSDIVGVHSKSGVVGHINRGFGGAGAGLMGGMMVFGGVGGFY